MKSLATAVLLGYAIGFTANEPWVLALAVFGFLAGIAYADIKMGEHYATEAAKAAKERMAWIAHFDGLARERAVLDWTMLRHMVSEHGWDPAEWKRCLDAQKAGVVEHDDGEAEGDMH